MITHLEYDFLDSMILKIPACVGIKNCYNWHENDKEECVVGFEEFLLVLWSWWNE